MKVREIMTTDVKVIAPNASLQEAARMMRSLDCGALPVCQDDRLVGMVTDRDLVVRGLAEDIDITTMRVADCMTTPLTFCFEDQSVDEVATLMKDKKVRRVAILNDAKRLVGIVALADLALSAPRQQMSHEILHRVSEPGAQAA